MENVDKILRKGIQMPKEVNKKFWKVRAEKFANLDWIKREKFINDFIKFCKPKKSFTALDLGSGTGVITCQLSKRVHNVIGIDISRDMIKRAQRNSDNIEYRLMNAENLAFPSKRFDLITARMVFHHIENLDKAMQEAHRVLKENSRMVLCEGVPPDRCVRKRYIEIFRLKEKRHTFYEDDLTELYKKANFKDIVVKSYIMKQVSMRNWLNNSGLPDDTCEKIVKLHLEGDDKFKKAYNMKIISEDIFFDWKFAFVSGVK